MTVLIPERLQAVKDIPLSLGSHSSPGGDTPGEFCLIEKHSYVTGQSWSDRSSETCCPTIAALGRRLNDRLVIVQPATLQEIDDWWFDPANLERIARTANDGHRMARAFLAADIAAREILPVWLDRAGKTDDAARLRAHPAVIDRQTARAATTLIREIRAGLPNYWAWRDEFVRKFTAAYVKATAAAAAAAAATDAAATAAATDATAATAAAATAAAATATATDATDAAATAATDAAATATAAAAAATAATAATATAATATAATATAATATADAATATATATATADADADDRYWPTYHAVYGAVYPVLLKRFGAPAVAPLQLVQRLVAVGEPVERVAA